MNLHGLFKSIIRISGVTCGLTILINKDIFYFDSMFLVVVGIWMWSEYDWANARKEENN